MRILLKLILLFILIGSLVLAWFYNDYKTFVQTPINNLANNQKEINFIIKPGANFSSIAKKLYQQKIISSALYFKIYAKREKKANALKAGEYTIEPNISISDLLALFISGKVKQYKLTIPEGWTVKQILLYLKTTQLKQTIGELSQQQLLKNLNLGLNHLEGYIFPDTYYFPKNSSDIDFLKRSIRKMQQVLDEQWKKRVHKLPLKSAYQALILASIVEKESGQKSERSKIAGVFIRRLNKGMRLQSDPTIIYGMGEAYKGNIRKKRHQ